ncbi:MAG: hypothetical protein WCP52_07950 [Bacteroidota bacterium]
MFTTKKLLVVKSVLFVASAVFMVSCGNNETAKDEADSKSVVKEDTTATAEVPETSYSLPSPLQIASIFKKSGLKYKSDLTSQMRDPSKYTSSLSKSLNLGVYSGDLSYCVMNKQSQEAMKYMKLCRSLADNLGMGSVFEEANLSKRFEKNLENEDSLAYIIAELQMVTDMYLDENDQQQITSIVFAGAWIESMYIGSKVYEKGKDKSLNNKLAEQMNILGSIINALKAVEKKEATIASLITDLKSIKDIYDALPSIKNAVDATDSDKPMSLTDDEVASLTKRISELRTKFVNGN